MLNEIEASQLSDIEFKELVIRKLNELIENNELTANYINMKREIELINKGQEEMKNTISELKKRVEGLKGRLDEAEDQIRELGDKVKKQHPEAARKGKEAQKE